MSRQHPRRSRRISAAAADPPEPDVAAEPDPDADDDADAYNAIVAAQRAVAPADRPLVLPAGTLADFKRRLRSSAQAPPRQRISPPGPVVASPQSRVAFRASAFADEGAQIPVDLAARFESVAVALGMPASNVFDSEDDEDEGDDDDGDDQKDVGLAAHGHAPLAHVDVLVKLRTDHLVFTTHYVDLAAACADACFHLSRCVRTGATGRELDESLDRVIVGLVNLEPVGATPVVTRSDTKQVVHAGGLENAQASVFCPDGAHDQKAWALEWKTPGRMLARARVVVPSHSAQVRNSLNLAHEMWRRQPFFGLLSVFAGIVTAAVMERPDSAVQFAEEINKCLNKHYTC